MSESPFERLKRVLNLKQDKENNTLSFEFDLSEKNDNLFTLGYNFVSTDPTLDLILDLGPYGMGNPAWNFPCPNAKKLKIKVEIIE